MHIDCDRCQMRGLACSDCVVTVLLGPIDTTLDGDEQDALGVLADAGLVPPLRLVILEDDLDQEEPKKYRKSSARDLPQARSAG